VDWQRVRLVLGFALRVRVKVRVSIMVKIRVRVELGCVAFYPIASPQVQSTVRILPVAFGEVGWMFATQVMM